MAFDFDWKRDYCGNLEWLQKNTILLTMHGSHAYGLATEASDIDIKGVAIPPKSYFLGYLHRFDQAESKNPDLTIYDLRKFFQLAADCNPNIVEILWTDEEDVIFINEWGKMIRHFRTHFLSKKAKYTFSGYAIAQLKRIKTHRKWLLNPPTHKPERAEFELPETALLSKDIMGAVESFQRMLIKDKDTIEIENARHTTQHVVDRFGPKVMHAYQRERAYHNALTQWHQYENWKETRNPARAEIEAKHGYDCKHAMHLVRLMRMCREILTGQGVIVKRPDREELLAIRNGAWTYDQLMEWSERQDAEMNELVEKSSLPKSPDRVYLSALCASIAEEYLHLGDVRERAVPGEGP